MPLKTFYMKYLLNRDMFLIRYIIVHRPRSSSMDAFLKGCRSAYLSAVAVYNQEVRVQVIEVAVEWSGSDDKTHNRHDAERLA